MLIGTSITLGILAVLTVLCILNRIGDKTYVHHVMLYIDIFLCALLTNNPNMTLSARCGLNMRRKDAPKRWTILGATLNKIQNNHCELAITADLDRSLVATKILSGK